MQAFGCQLQHQGRSTEGARENAERPYDVWVLPDGCEDVELLGDIHSTHSGLPHRVLQRTAFADFESEGLAQEACAKDHAVRPRTDLLQRSEGHPESPLPNVQNDALPVCSLVLVLLKDPVVLELLVWSGPLPLSVSGGLLAIGLVGLLSLREKPLTNVLVLFVVPEQAGAGARDYFWTLPVSLLNLTCRHNAGDSKRICQAFRDRV